MVLESPAFENNETIPQLFTCDGENINPHLVISDVPKNAESLALIVDDPDAPGGGFTHWLVYNLDPSLDEIAEGSLPSGAKEGLNDSGEVGYTGPCPPAGEHYYHFILLALDTNINFPQPPNRETFEEAIKGHVLDQTELVGMYSREEGGILEEE